MSAKSSPQPGQESPRQVLIESDPVRYYNDAVIALNVLYEVAVVSEGARKDLHDLVERLLETACRWKYRDARR